MHAPWENFDMPPASHGENHPNQRGEHYNKGYRRGSGQTHHGRFQKDTRAHNNNNNNRNDRNQPWQSIRAIELGLWPRPFGEIHSERAYLLDKLQEHDSEARELFGRLPTVEEHISWSVNVPDELKKARKHRGWLKQRIKDTVEEERKVMARLGEIHVELQCRERWCQVERERELRSLRACSLGCCSNRPTPPPPPPPPAYPTPPPALSFAATPPWLPRATYPQTAAIRTYCPCGCGGPYQYSQEYLPLAVEVVPVNNQEPRPYTQPQNGGDIRPLREKIWVIEERSVDGKAPSTTPRTGDLPCEGELFESRPLRKLKSLPSLRYTWAEEHDGRDDAVHRCLGLCSPD
ncbi:Uu.00g018630.m01.CDS01 [Anthostomella pinea]|uniref:Uu.00g018630.m01.CDS01 n=1 Tax=Anthostomella pinea TaxID=933095 RepID=A0AAI8YQK3_9PEZI|nr:Uu.00g018630.m01.CDS01 [Anthostomella pinea]